MVCPIFRWRDRSLTAFDGIMNSSATAWLNITRSQSKKNNALDRGDRVRISISVAPLEAESKVQIS